MTGAAAVTRVLCHQRAELGRAGAFRLGALAAQLALAIVASVSVFTDNHATLLVLAVIGTILLVAWLVLDRYHRRHRSAGDEARRIILISHGLGGKISGLDSLAEKFTAPIEDAQGRTIDEYFATCAEAGMQRLAEMTDESAFFTGDLQRRSGELMLVALGVCMILFVGVCLLAPQLMGHGTAIAFVRIVMALMVFFLSSDLLGAAFGHRDAGNEMRQIRLRIAAARARSYPPSEVLLIMTDYNATVEAAPMPIPGLYDRIKRRLNSDWAAYKALYGIGS